MVNAIYITDNRGETLELKLTNPYDNGIYVNKVEGLGYPQTNINSSKISSYDVALYNSQEVSERNIVLTLGLTGAPSVEGSRHLLYEYLPIRCSILIEFSTDERVAYVNGYVETIEPDIFNSQEVVQVSIICLDPYFHIGGSKKTYIQSGNIYPNFQFNSWFTDDPKPVGIIEDRMIININSRFQNPQGFALVIHGRDGGFDTIEIEYEGGSIIINDRTLDPYGENVSLEDNLFHIYDDLRIRNDIELISIEKISSDGTAIDMIDKSKITNDLPSLKSGNNWFKIITKGIKEIFGQSMLRRNVEPYTTTITYGYEYSSGGPTYFGVGRVTLPADAYQINVTVLDRSAIWKIKPSSDSSLKKTDDDLYYFFDKNGLTSYGGTTEYRLAVRINDDPKKVDGKHIFDDNGTIIGFYLIIVELGVYFALRIYDAEIYILNDQTPYEWSYKHVIHFTTGYDISTESLLLEVNENEILKGYEYENTNSMIDVVIEHDDMYEAL